MLEIIVQGPSPQQSWRGILKPGMQVGIGRGATDAPVLKESVGPAGEWVLTIPWDGLISRRHASVSVHPDHVLVNASPAARNPVFAGGKEVESCRIESGGHFVLGATVFRISLAETVSAGPPTAPIEQLTYSSQQLRKVRYHDPENRLEVLTHLPELISGSSSEPELLDGLVKLLLRGISHAEAVAVVGLSGEDGVRILHWDRRRETAGPFQTSRRLVHAALGPNRTSVLHVWDANAADELERTLNPEFDWAYCTPVTGLSQDTCGIYVAGKMGKSFAPGATLSDQLQLDADVKFTELLAEIMGSVLTAKRLERQKAGLRQFFAPPILAALGNDLDTTLLEPCECDVTVMFCDLRGFSQRAENAADDLIGLLERVSRALGVMTQQILAHGGVTGDFQGDATLGFWGWPFPSPEATMNAAKAALAIRSAFARTAAQRNHPLADFAMGIGLAHGRAVAGKIGTAEQVKVTVFGPVVNLASRLEGMTKQLRVPILVDDVTANLVRSRLNPNDGRLRTLAQVQPYGLERPVTVSELLPPEHEFPQLTNQHLATFERGVECFRKGEWDDAYHALHSMPPGDRAQDFLIQHIIAGNRQPPAGWDGIIRLPQK